MLPEVVHERARDDAVRKRPRPKPNADLGGDLRREHLEILELEARQKGVSTGNRLGTSG